ncbi:hypothetical protein, partial [Psychromonas aquimarina]|uniref:hypothetical protein n=1 Tax=Psychromonas aquimarina TaxID=444919 RepID=UPI001B7FC695
FFVSKIHGLKIFMSLVHLFIKTQETKHHHLSCWYENTSGFFVSVVQEAPSRALGSVFHQ